MVRFFRLILFLILLFNSHSYAFVWQNALYKLATGIHWAIVTTPALLLAGNQIGGSAALKQYPQVSCETETWVKEQLMTYKCPQELVDNLEIRAGRRFQAGYILNGKHVITIPNDLQNVQTLSSEQKMRIAVTLRHEAAHLEHKDMWRMTGAWLAAPFLSHYLFNTIMHPIQHLVRPHSSLTIQSIAKIPSAAAKLALMFSGMTAFSKYKEYSADKKAAQSIDDPAALLSQAQLCLKMYENYENKKQLNPQERGTLRRFIYDELHTPDITHPNYLLRSKIFETAAKEIVHK